MDLYDLPLLNAILNGSCATLLLIGRSKIKRNERDAHKKIMIAAFSVSVLFLISYLIYHYNVGSVGFKGEGWSRPLYFTILISHTVLAAAVPFLAILSLRRGLKSQFALHRKVARWTYPIWLYVSVTGVLIYLMLYHIWPSRVLQV
ncbi:MAG TPA: DUF420 domain-containing protein [Candidatus Kapabacteria bacterium]|nr:DUF420 domain-containing protein [Candidatus Kapabacteria bacterium]